MNNSRFKLLSVAGVSLLMLASCSNDEVYDSADKGNVISFTSRMSRATESTTATLEKPLSEGGGFKVFADVAGYSQLIINGETAEYNSTSQRFEINKEVYWSKDMNKIYFWAFSPTDVTAAISSDAQSINFKPEQSLEKGGIEQKDLIVAYEEKEYGQVPDNAVQLNFKHALSRIYVNAINESNDTKVLKIKGAWIVNVNDRGILTFDKDADTYPDHMKWVHTNASKVSYGLPLSNVQMDGGVNATLIGGSDNSDLMLVPQTITGCDYKGNGGSYILLLARVELHHEGATHPGEGTDNDLIGTDGDHHIHQLFPAVGDSYNENAYGYTSVAITDIEWKPSYKYIYNLKFFGSDSGAGVYPPTNHPDITVPGVHIIDNTDAKKVGTPIIDKPISFTVKVGEWKNGADSSDEDADIDTPMK